MTRINLLPWRETHRLKKNREFYIQLALCMSLAACVGFAGLKYAQGKVDFQNSRNDRLKSEIALLQEELKEIKELTETKNNLLARMEIIQQLQGQRPQIVHTLQEIATRLPDGIYLTSLRQSGNQQLSLEGHAESNARVSALMRQMDRSEYFTRPRLDIIESEKDESISKFKLNLIQDKPNSDAESDNGI